MVKPKKKRDDSPPRRDKKGHCIRGTWKRRRGREREREEEGWLRLFVQRATRYPVHSR